jgi:hypothetical protein
MLYQVKVVVHQSKVVDLPVGSLARFAQGSQKQKPIFVVAKDRFAAVSSVHYVMNLSLIPHSELPSHIVPASMRHRLAMSRRKKWWDGKFVQKLFF